MKVQEEKPYDEINITPMLDLSYVLLVIFIIMCTAMSQELKVNLPTSSSKPLSEKVKNKAILISSDGRIFLDGTPISLDSLEQRLTTLKSGNPEMGVSITGDGKAQFNKVMDVIAIVTRVGILKIGMSGASPKK